MKDSYAVLIAVSIGILFASVLAVPVFLSGYSGFAGSQSGGSFFGGMMSTQGQTVSIDQTVQTMKNVPQYVDVVQSNNTIIFTTNISQGSIIKIVALATDIEGAANITNSKPPSYATDDLFVIYGLIDPTLVIPHGTSVQVTFVNLDKDMYHNFVISTLAPPYSYMSMMGGSWQQRGTWVAMMPFLPAANYNQDVAHEYTYTITLSNQQQANLWYLCTYPGHAQDGMYGEILII